MLASEERSAAIDKLLDEYNCRGATVEVHKVRAMLGEAMVWAESYGRKEGLREAALIVQRAGVGELIKRAQE